MILDLSMPVMNGIDAANALKQIMPEVPIFMLTAHVDTAIEFLAGDSGISAVFSKDDVTPRIPRARAELEYV